MQVSALGPEVGRGMVAVRITPDMEMAIVGTPEHFRRYGFPQTPADLKAHPLYRLSVCRRQRIPVGTQSG